MGDNDARRRAIVARAAVTLVVGVTVGVIVGGALHLFGGSSGNAARAAADPPQRVAGIARGNVTVDPAVGRLPGAVALGKTRTRDGAAAAFTSYAVWLVGSPAAAADPEQAVRAVGGSLVDPADAHQLARMQRGTADRFAAEAGAYRVLGWSGSPTTPAEVMVEVTAPLTLAGTTTWRTIGGVVGWASSGWQLVSVRPRTVPQPSRERGDVAAFSDADRARTLAGLGWQTFATRGAR